MTAGPLVRVEAEGAQALAAVLAAAMPDAWSAAQLASTLREPTGAALARERVGRPGEWAGVAVVRAAAGEAELLIVAVRPDCQGQGIGRLLVEDSAALARKLGALVLHLEVREGNAAARRVYALTGFVEVGRRRGYYQGREDALLLARELVAGA